MSVAEIIEEFVIKLQTEIAYGDPVTSIELTPAAYSCFCDEMAAKCKYLSRESFNFSKGVTFLGIDIRAAK